jgi:hypothetical protein
VVHIISAERYSAQRSFRGIVRNADLSVGEEAGEGVPAFKDVFHRFFYFVMARWLCAFGTHPDLEIGDDGRALFLACGLAASGAEAIN